MKEYYRVWADINLDAIYENLARTKKRIKAGTKIMAVIKADGYGHGAVPIAIVLDPLADSYAVAALEEGVELREAGITKPILILGNTPPEQYEDLFRYDIMPAVFYYGMAEGISKEACRQGKQIKIHIKLDTGMGRIGFPPTEPSLKELIKINGLKGIIIEGCFTHFARADEENKDFTYEQINSYLDFLEKLKRAGIKIRQRHISNSAGIIDIPEANLDMVRSGISSYGIYPSACVDKKNLLLEPAMSIRSRVSFVKEVEAGAGISYGSTYITEKTMRIATIPVGYGDGYKRALSSKGRILIKGKPAPILGRICMDQFMVDVTQIPNVKTGDLVTLLGRDKEECITVEELSQLSDSFPYEFVCDIGKRVPRVFYFKGEKAGTLDYHHCTGAVYDLKLR